MSGNPLIAVWRAWLPLAALGFSAVTLSLEAQQVIALRMLRIAVGEAAANREARRMVTEKVQARAEIGMLAALSAATGTSQTAIAKSILRGYSSRVRANRRRLSR